MTAAQRRALALLGVRSMTTVGVAQGLNSTVASAQRVLDALYSRSWVTVTPQGRWCATERGRKKAAA